MAAGRDLDEDRQEDAVEVPARTVTSPSATALRLAKGYPPVLGAMLMIDSVVALLAGWRAVVSLGEVAVYLLLPPVTMLLLGLLGNARPRVAPLAATGAAVAALIAALILGRGFDLFAVPAWAEAIAGAALLGVAAFLFAPRRQHVGRRRRD